MVNSVSIICHHKFYGVKKINSPTCLKIQMETYSSQNLEDTPAYYSLEYSGDKNKNNVGY